MAADDDLKEAIVDTANSPASNTVNGFTTTGQKISDLIAADKYLAAKKAAKCKGTGIQFIQIVAPGSR